MKGTDAVVCSEGQAERYLINTKTAALGPKSSLDASHARNRMGKQP